MNNIITVDGPSGAGKGTVCRLLATHLGYGLLDSGALYRIAALAALTHDIDLTDECALAELAANLDIEFIASDDRTTILLNGSDVSSAIREERTGMAASHIAPLPGLRAALLDRQRAFASEQSLIADGRDMGTIVFPEAQHKIFLTATAEERARRRVQQLKASGETDVDFNQVFIDIKARDDRDMNRTTAPLKAAEDAIVIDSSELTIEDVLRVCLEYIDS